MGFFEGALIELLEIDESSESALAKFSANGDRHLHKRRRRDNEGFSSTVLHGYDTPGSASEGPVNEDMTSAPSTPAEATMDLDNYAISDQDQKVSLRIWKLAGLSI